MSASLVKRNKSSLEVEDPDVWCAPCKLGDLDLGLSRTELELIQEKATHIIHVSESSNQADISSV